MMNADQMLMQISIKKIIARGGEVTKFKLFTFLLQTTPPRKYL